MHTSALEKIAAELHAINRNIQFAAFAGYSANILAAKIQSAKTDYERNKAIKEADELLETMKKAVSGEGEQ
jgi:menaquinone-dependent protoporphyrinogen IX oxidase